MKKLMISLCALCFAGAVSAQVTRPALSEKAQSLSQSPVMTLGVNRHNVQTAEAMLDRKAGARIDSVVVQSAYSWDNRMFTLGWFPLKGQEDLDQRYFCNEDQIRWTYGTGGPITWWGSGEIGYRFWSGKKSYYDLRHLYPNYGVPYAASTYIIRAPSTSLLHRENGEEYYDPMPFRFKIYNSSKVSEQAVIASITQDAYPDEGYMDVVYPTDPENYTAMTDTLWIKAGCIMYEGQQHLYDTLIKGEFRNVDASQRLGDNFCVSMMFPIDWDEEGDSIITPKWNASPMVMLQGEAGLVSEEPHSIYSVLDLQRDDWWRRSDNTDLRLGERPSWIVEDSLMQPNARYAVIAFDSYYMTSVDGSISNSTDEFWMRIYYTNWTSLQSANKADRYVQVSPVPAVDYVNFTSYADMSRIEIYSLGGQLVKAMNVSGDTYRLDISGMNSGMYVARIYSEKGISSQKLIVR